MIDVVEASIADLRAALDAGDATAAKLVDSYLARIDAYDGPGTETALNAVVVRNPDAREIFARGGGIHCITQQQPTVAS